MEKTSAIPVVMNQNDLNLALVFLWLKKFAIVNKVLFLHGTPMLVCTNPSPAPLGICVLSCPDSTLNCEL